MNDIPLKKAINTLQQVKYVLGLDTTIGTSSKADVSRYV